MNLNEARTELAARGFDELSPTRLTSFLNIAKSQFEDAYTFPWLEASEAGTSPLTIEDLKQVLHVVDTSNHVELEGVTSSYIVAELSSDLDAQGQPLVWWLDGENVVKTWPVNTSTQLSVRYLKQSPELTDNTDTPLIPVRYHQTWIDLAVVRAHMDADAPDLAASARAVASQDLAQIISRYETRNRQNAVSQIIRGDAEDW